MGKFSLIPIVFISSSFSGGVQAALMNVASIEFTVSSSKYSDHIRLNEVILSENGSGDDLALASSGATVFVSPHALKHDSSEGDSSEKSSSEDYSKRSPAHVIDGIVSKKNAYQFLKREKDKSDLPSLTINLAQISDINSFNFFGSFGEKKKAHLGVNFLDVNGNSLYKIANLVETFGKKNSGLYILPDVAGQVSAVPLPASIWLFGFGLFGMLGIARKHVAMRSIESL